MGTEKKTIDIHFTKSPTYRTYHLDGVFGGLTPKGIFIDIFTEQISPPSKIVHEIKKDGNIGDEIGRTNEKVGILREFQCGIVIDIDKAVSVKNWLENKINEFQIGVKK